MNQKSLKMVELYVPARETQIKKLQNIDSNKNVKGKKTLEK